MATLAASNMPVKAIFFDFLGVLYHAGSANRQLLGYIREHLKPHYQIGIITSSRDVGRYIDAAIFNSITSSADIGIAKPDPAIFTLACQRLSVQPAQAIFIDDLPENCAGARKAGMQAIGYTDFLTLRRQLEELLPRQA